MADEEWKVSAVLDEDVFNGVEHIKVRWANSWITTEEARVAAALRVEVFLKEKKGKKIA